MKIFYAVQATGNGHISRAMQLLPYLEKYGSVDIFLSGSNHNMSTQQLPVKYRSSGISLFFTKRGALSYSKTVFNNNYFKCIDDILRLPLESYDMVINDFEFITSKACALKNIPSVQMSHQASFMSKKTPRPKGMHLISEMVLKHYAPANQYLGFHFKAYDDFITTPVIKDTIQKSIPTDKGHVTVYLPTLNKKRGLAIFHRHPDIEFHWFYSGCKSIQKEKNVTLFPISDDGFTKSMMDCHGVITGGGFETPAEAMYLGKKLMCIPIKGHFEQMSNAIAAQRLGAEMVSDIFQDNLAERIEKWINRPQIKYDIVANNIEETLGNMMANYPRQ